MLSQIGRLLFALLLGVLLGAGGMGWVFHSGAGDFVLSASPVVQDLERRLEEVDSQRNQLGRRLEDVAARAEASESRFRALEARLTALVDAAEHQQAAARENTPETAVPAPSAPASIEADGE